MVEFLFFLFFPSFTPTSLLPLSSLLLLSYTFHFKYFNTSTLPYLTLAQPLLLLIISPLILTTQPSETGLSSSAVKHLEPVLGVRLAPAEEEEEESIRKREANYEPFPSKMNLDFQSFGKQFSYQLEVQREITKGGKLIVYGENEEVIEERPYHAKSYKAPHYDQEGKVVGWAVASLHSDGLFHALIHDGEELYVVDPISRHERELHPTSKRHLEQQSPLVLFL